jgi:hypothetical protein
LKLAHGATIAHDIFYRGHSIFKLHGRCIDSDAECKEESGLHVEQHIELEIEKKSHKQKEKQIGIVGM